MRKKTIFVAGTSEPAPGQDIGPAVKAAEEAGKEIAENDCILLCGGRCGVMEAAAKGCKEAGGLTVCVVPSDNRKEANSFCDIAIASGIGYMRNYVLAYSADAMVVVQGNSGTMVEATVGYFLGIPVVAVQGTGGTADRIGGEYLDAFRKAKILSAKNGKEAVQIALEQIKP